MAGRVNRARLYRAKTAFTLSVEPLSEQVLREKEQSSEKLDNSRAFSTRYAIRQQSP
jgi:hypothetical protein